MADAGELESLRMSFETDALAGTRIVVERMRVEEVLDEPYVATIELRIHDADADASSLLGVDGALIIDRQAQRRRLCGLVRRVWEGERDLVSVRAKIELVPALFLLSLRRNTRMFQEKSVPDILKDVLEGALGDHDRELQLELRATYPTREYCVQYQERDLDFAHRLMEEEGISYAFDHEGEVEVMVLRDDNAAFARAPSPSDPIEYHPHNLHARDREAIHRFERRHRHVTTSVALRDFDWSSADFVVEDEEPGQDVRGRDRESYEHGLGRTLTLSGYDGSHYAERDAARQKTLRLEAHGRDQRSASGVSRVIGLAPGTTFELSGHPTLGADGEYLVTKVVHVSEPAESPAVTPTGAAATGKASSQATRASVTAAGKVEAYHNRFECIPLAVPYRPTRRSEKPSIAGIQTAVVTGPSGEEIHTDSHGRIKVQFHWDRENAADEKSSCWVRCEQAWAGTGWGFFWLPRIGMEVIVHFLGGDPDRPLVTGCVYDADNTPPYPLPDEKTKSTIKSNSSPGGGGSNELRFEDAKGSEEIYAHAQKDYREVVENDHTTTVHHDQSNTVDNDQTQSVGANQTETVHGSQQLGVGGDRAVEVGGNFDETIDGTETRSVTGDVTETFSANEGRTVGANLKETIGASETRSVSGNQEETIGASHSRTIGAASTRTITGSLSETITGGITEMTPASYLITATAGFKVNAPGGITMNAPAGVKLLAPGGVSWVDREDNWFGSFFIECDATGGDTFALKLEGGGVAYGVTGVKCEQAGVELINEGSRDEKSAANMAARPILVAGGAIRKWVGGLFNRGG